MLRTGSNGCREVSAQLQVAVVWVWSTLVEGLGVENLHVGSLLSACRQQILHGKRSACRRTLQSHHVDVGMQPELQALKGCSVHSPTHTHSQSCRCGIGNIEAFIECQGRSPCVTDMRQRRATAASCAQGLRGICRRNESCKDNPHRCFLTEKKAPVYGRVCRWDLIGDQQDASC